MRTEWIRRMCKIPRAGPGKSSTIVTMNPTQPLLYHHNIHNHRKRICQWPSSKRMIRSNCKEIFTYLFKDYPFRLNWLLSTHPGFFLPKAVNKSTFWREESQDLRLSFKGESLSKKNIGLVLSILSICAPSPASYPLLALELKAVFPLVIMLFNKALPTGSLGTIQL